MTSTRLENLVQSGELKREPADRKEFEALLAAARKRLADAGIAALSFEGRFLSAYAAAHAASLAALRWHGYRTDKRYLVFQVLPETLGLGPEVWRVLSKCHELRNLAEYEGHFDADELLFQALLESAGRVVRAAGALSA